MRILVVTAADATNLTIENIVKEFLKRGHEIEIYARFPDYKSIRMFLNKKLPIHLIQELNEKVIKNFDIAFCGVDAISSLLLYDIFVFNYNFITNGWLSDGSDFMFTIGRDRDLLYREFCSSMPIGNPKNDTACLHKEEKQFLYIDAGHIPYGIKGKRQVAKMLLDICEKFPDYKLVIKPRWLPSDKENLTHVNYEHVYELLNELADGNLPSNLVCLMEHMDLQELIDRSKTVITSSTSCYLDVALRNKGVIAVGGFDCEDQIDHRTNIIFKKEYDNLKTAKCYVDYREVTNYLPDGNVCDPNYLEKFIPYKTGVSEKIADVVEYVYSHFIKHNKFPEIRDYDYTSYKDNMKADVLLSWEKLKHNRIKNSILRFTREFSSIDAEIDFNPFFEELEKTYLSIELTIESVRSYRIYMEKIYRRILIENADKLQHDAINQSILFWAYYMQNQYSKLYSILPEEVLCKGPYNYYMGLVHKELGYVDEAVRYFICAIEDIWSRGYAKYREDNYIAKICEFLLEYYNGNNISARELVEIYVEMHDRNIHNVKYSVLQKMHLKVPSLIEQIYEADHELAFKVQKIYIENIQRIEVKQLESTINELRGKLNTLSYKIGMSITWPYRKIDALIYSLRHNGLWGSITRMVSETKIGIFHTVWEVFKRDIVKGYKRYAELVSDMGETDKLLMAAHALGDAFIWGLFFESYASSHFPGRTCYIGVSGEAGKEIVNMLGIKNSKALKKSDFCILPRWTVFMHDETIRVASMGYSVCSGVGILARLGGLHQFNFKTLIGAYLNVSHEKEFVYDKSQADLDFHVLGVTPGKTVILAPYANSLPSVAMSFWTVLARRLQEKGFVCVTNCAQDESSISGTERIFVKWKNMISLCEYAGVIVGSRSGLLDIVNSADCLKISIAYPYKKGISDNVFVNLREMFHRENQYDYIYDVETKEVLLDEIVSRISEYLSKETD